VKVAGYLKTSLLDWPGEVSSVIWTQGCNFRCPFCHNRDLISLTGKKLLDEGELIKSLIQRKIWITHLVITGGEPTLQTDLVEFCQKLKKMGFKIKMDTNGSEPEVVEKLIKMDLVEYWAMDIKTQFDKYQFGDIKDIKKSMKLIAKSGKDYEFRTTVVPGMHDEEVVKQMAKEIKNNWIWQKFVGRNCVDPKLDGAEGITKKEIEKWRKGVGVKVDLRGWV
jgi:pyruvate formate lyase activating enzyme